MGSTDFWIFDRDYAMQHLNGILGDWDEYYDINGNYRQNGTKSMAKEDRDLILEKEFDLRSLDPRFDCKTGLLLSVWHLDYAV